MPFIHPVIFWSGLAAVSLPILIHLLNRRRFRMRDWAAMQFLLDSLRRNRRRLRIEELILLALRCLVILLLAAGIARFTGCGPMHLLPGGPGPQTTVFVLDDSCSMAQKFRGGTLLGVAAADLAERIGTLAQSEKVAILLASTPARDEAFFALNYVTDAESLVQRLRTLRPSDGRARLPETLAAANDILADTSGGRRLVILSDFRQADLAGADPGGAIRKQFEALRAQDVQIDALDYGLAGSGNLTLEAVELLDKFAVAKVPVRLAVSVRNHGRSRAENVEIRVAARVLPDSGTPGGTFGEMTLPVQVIESIEPGGTGRVEFQLTPARPGPMGIVARLSADELPPDNTARLGLDVRKAIRLLVVDGKPNRFDPPAAESYFFVNAIDDGKGGYGNAPQVVTLNNLPDVNFHEYDLVVLLNLREMPSLLDEVGKLVCPQLEALETYVRDGGGLAVFAGDRVSTAFYGPDGAFWRRGGGLLPLPLRPRVGDAGQRETFFRLDPRSIDPQGPMQTFAGEAGAIASLIRFFAFNAADEPAVPPTPGISPPRVLARFTDPAGSPAVVQRQFGKGTVVAFHTTAGDGWTDWPSDPVGTYVAVMNDLVADLARAQRQGFTAVVGQGIAYEPGEEFRDAEAVLRTPDYPAVSEIALTAERSETRPPIIKYERPDRAGLYRLDLSVPAGARRTMFFARNVDPAEGDLAVGRRPHIASAFGGDEFFYEQRLGDDVGRAEKSEAQTEYWLWAVAAVLVLLALETFLAQRFGHYSAPADERK